MKQTAEVVIIGGGCMGASVAYHLTEQGVTDVVLVEREPQLGTGSTGRNAGGFRHQFSNAANIELSKESVGMFADFEQLVGYPIDFWQDGTCSCCRARPASPRSGRTSSCSGRTPYPWTGCRQARPHVSRPACR